MPPRKPKDITIENLRKWEPIRVMWEDALHAHEPKNSAKYIAEYKPTVRQSIGWFVGTTEGHKHIFVTMSADKFDAEPDEDDCQATDVIPMGMVLRITRLSFAETVKVPGR